MGVSDQPDFCIPTLGPISKESRWEWRSQLANDNGIVNGTTPANFLTGTAYKGKFFPRGCRGKFERIGIYCRRTATGTLTLSISPEPGMGPCDTIVITPGATWAWYSANWRHFWNYDSLFIWVSACSADVSYAYDVVQPYDAHTSDSTIEHWQREDRRYFIRVIYDAETPGDVPVSGTINNVEIPKSSSARFYITGACGPANPLEVSIYGAGTCEFIVFRVNAVANSHLTGCFVDVDGRTAFWWDFVTANTHGFMSSTPGLSLTVYAANGICVMVLSMRFEFRRRLYIYMMNGLAAPNAMIEGYANLIR